MRKILLILTLITLFGAVAAAQSKTPDIIITKKGDKIEAKITEIDLDNVKYKKFNYQDGPAYTIPKCDIASVAYSNGEVEVFDCDKSASSGGNAYDGGKTIPENMPLSYFAGQILRKNGDLYTFEGTNKNMDENTYSDFLQSYCPTAYNTYSSGRRNHTAGIILGSIGASIFGVGIICLSVGFYYGPNAYFYDDMWISGASLIGGGGVISLGIGLPLGVVGNHKMNNALDTYNSYCGKKNKTTASLNLGFTGNGIGFRINF